MEENICKGLKPKDWCSVAWKILLVMALLHSICCFHYANLPHSGPGLSGAFEILFAIGFFCSVAGNIVLILLLPLLKYFIAEIFASSTLQKSVTFSFIFSFILFFLYLMTEIAIIVYVDNWNLVPLFLVGAIIFQFLPFTVIYTCLMVRKAKKLEERYE